MDKKAAQEREYWDNTYRILSIENDTINIFPDCLEPYRYTNKFLYTLFKTIQNKKVLSVGGGIDRFGVHVAKNNNRVTSIDVAPEAAKRTAALAKKHNVEQSVTPLTMNCEEMNFENEFDVVISRHALHHMNFYPCLDKIQTALVPGGTFLADEPVCLSPFLRCMHRALPFHPEPLCFSNNESEFGHEELAHIKNAFEEVSFNYFDLFTRESIMYVMYKLGLEKILPFAGKIDASILKAIPVLRPFCSYIIISAVKPRHEQSVKCYAE